MDIDILAGLVKKLIMVRDEVELPGVGTFVAELSPAQFTDRGYTIQPPYRRLYFRQRTHGDTALIDSYALECQGDAESAGRELSAFLLELRDVLKDRKTIILPGLGRLRATRENHFFFVPDENLDIYPDGFSLEPLSLKFHATPDAGVLDGLVAAVTGQTPAEGPALVPESSVPDGESAQSATPKPESSAPDREQPEIVIPAPAEPAGRGAGRRFIRAVAWASAVCVLLLGLLALLGRVAPGLVDPLLYNQEELSIIHHA